MSRAFHIKNNYTAGTSALSTLVTKQATFVCKYLLAFDHWQTKSNPRNNTESEIAKRELIRLNQTQDFDELSADLASAGPNSNEEEKELYWLSFASSPTNSTCEAASVYVSISWKLR